MNKCKLIVIVLVYSLLRLACVFILQDSRWRLKLAFAKPGLRMVPQPPTCPDTPQYQRGKFLLQCGQIYSPLYLYGCI